MKILVSAELAGQAPDLQDITPWLSQTKPVWEGEPPLGVFLSDGDHATYKASDFAALMTLLAVPLALDENLTDFRAAAMAARVNSLKDAAFKERAAAAALRKDFMELQQNFVSVEDYLYTALTPKFTLARQWDFAGENKVLDAGQVIDQALPISNACLAAVDLWMTSGVAQLSLWRSDHTQLCDAVVLSGTGWQRAQFPIISGEPQDIFLRVETEAGCEIGLSHAAPLPVYGENPLALRLWHGLTGVRLPKIGATADTPQFVLPCDFPTVDAVVGSAHYVDSENILMIHLDFKAEAEITLRGISLPPNSGAHIQNRGPEWLTVSMCQVPAGMHKPLQAPSDVVLERDAYMRCDVQNDNAQAVDLIIKIKGQTSLDRLCLRGFQIG